MKSGQQNLLGLIGPIRNLFLSQLMGRLASLRAEDFEFETEVIHRDASGAVARSDVLNLPHRTDIEIHETGTRFAVDLNDDVWKGFEPTTIWLSDAVSITLRPFAWNAVVIGFEMDGNVRQLRRLRNWYLEWFQSRLFADAPALDGAVHSLSGPEQCNGFWVMKIDLGTAPIEAMIDLLEALISSGVTEIEIGSAVMTGQVTN